MSNLTIQSPPMDPVDYRGQTYYSSQYFHQQYLTNSQHGGKFRRHDSFVRLLRTIPAYAVYLQQQDIVEVEWNTIKSTKSEGTLKRSSFQPLFQAAGWNPLTLLNATAQLALSHHLDDELSKQVSVAANTAMARQMTRKAVGPALPEETAVRKLEAYLQLGRLLKTPEHIVQQEAAKQIAATTGIDLRPMLLAAPAQDDIVPETVMSEPTDLAKAFGFSSGQAFNIALEHIGWQVKKIEGGWEPTPVGTPYAALHAWTAKQGTKSGYNLKWQRHAVEQALLAHGVITPTVTATVEEMPHG